MKNSMKVIPFLIVFCLSLVFSTAKSYANNFDVSNVSLEGRDPSVTTVVVQFDVSWENSWRTKINHDAAWLTIRLYDPTQTPTNKKLCQVSQAGLSPVGSSTGSSSDIEVYVPSDRNGAYIRPSSYGTHSSISSEGVQVTIDYSTCGFTSADTVQVSVLGVEMVYVPEGAFYVGDHDTSAASLNEGSADTDPWYISGEASIGVSNPSTNGYRYVSASNAGEDATGTSFTIPTSFPKGYQGFYAMKYEITEGLWVEFLNALPSAAARANHDLTDSSHKNTDTVSYRNTINCSGSPLSCATTRSTRPVSFIDWVDLAAFLDWMALRPMTELEFEKMSRGPLLAVGGEFAWGTVSITAADALSTGAEDGSESVTTTDANAHYNNQTLTGGDTTNGTDYEKGPIRSGIFATSTSTRETAGASYYGVMELSGNLSERAVTIGNADGRAFEGTHGDGYLTTESSYEGYATNTDWPGIDPVIERGVTGGSGSGFRGGSWSDQSSGARLRISDRQDAANTSVAAFNNVGGRGVRTHDEN